MSSHCLDLFQKCDISKIRLPCILLYAPVFFFFNVAVATASGISLTGGIFQKVLCTIFDHMQFTLKLFFSLASSLSPDTSQRMLPTQQYMKIQQIKTQYYLFHILEKNQCSVELDGEACLRQKIVESIKTFSKTGIRPHMTKTAKQQIVSKNVVPI